jgi:hypothetical protein
MPQIGHINLIDSQLDSPNPQPTHSRPDLGDAQGLI